MARLTGMFWKDCSKNTTYSIHPLLHFLWCGFSEERYTRHTKKHQGWMNNKCIPCFSFGKKKTQTGCNFLCLDLVVPWGVWLRGSCLLNSCPATLCSFLKKKSQTKNQNVCNKTSCYVIQEKHCAIIQGLEGLHLPDWRRKAKYRQVLVSRKMAWHRIRVQDQIHFRKRRKWGTTIDVESSPVGSNLRVCLPSALPSSLPHLKTAQTPLDPHSPPCLSNSAKASS